MLYLVRHGDAKPSIDDPQKPLTLNGQKEIKHLSMKLKNKGCRPNTIVHSPKTRAIETAKILGTQLTTSNYETSPLLSPSSDPYPWIDRLSIIDEETIFVSHLPFIGELLYALTQNSTTYSSTQFNTGTCVKLIKKNQTLWQLDWVINP